MSLSPRRPFAARELLAFLAARAVPGLEEVAGGAYTRSVRLAHGPAVVRFVVEEAPGAVGCRLMRGDARDAAAAQQLCRRVLDLDADAAAFDARLAGDPLLRPLVEATPGRRVAGCVDGAELAVRAVLGQQISVAGAVTATARLVARHGEPLPEPVGSVTHLFPAPAALTAAELPGPATRRAALRTLARALADGLQLDPGADHHGTRHALLALRGIGPWTAEYIAMRALRDPDAFPAGDLGVRHALEQLGEPGRPAAALRRAEAWRPWRAYAVAHLWAALPVRRPAAAPAPPARPRIATSPRAR